MPEPLLGGIDPAGWFAEQVVDAAGSVASPILSGLGASLWRWLSEACTEVGREVVGALSGSGGIDLTSGWWAGPRTREVTGLIVGLAGALMVAFLLLTLLQGLIAGDPIGMCRSPKPAGHGPDREGRSPGTGAS